MLVRGAEQAGGAHRPRVVWQKSQRVWDGVGAASGSGVRAFIKRLKRVRGRDERPATPLTGRGLTTACTRPESACFSSITYVVSQLHPGG